MWPCIVTNFFLNKTNRRTIFPNLFLSRNSTCFGQFLCPLSGVFHCTFGTGVCHAGSMTAFKHDQDGTAVPVPNVQWKTPDDGQRNCLKHVEFLDKNKFGKLVHLLVLLKKKFVTMHGHMSPCTVTWTFVYVFKPMYISTCDSMNGRYWERKTCILLVQ